jgi:hypothetical protein
MNANTSINDLLSTPLGPEWTVDRLAEQVLGAIVAQDSEQAQELVLDSSAITDRQSRRLLRPLIACLATKSAAESGTPANLYGGRLTFKRLGPKGYVWIIGQFENGSGRVCVTLRGSSSPSRTSQPPESGKKEGVNGGWGSRATETLMDENLP